MKDLLRLRRAFVVSCEQTCADNRGVASQFLRVLGPSPPSHPGLHDRSTPRRQRTADPASTQEAEVMCEV